MAGQHQIWRHNVDNGITSVFSGNGYERNKNGGNGTDTSWAQPSGDLRCVCEDGERSVPDYIKQQINVQCCQALCQGTNQISS